MSVRREDNRWTMACAIVELEKAGWTIAHIQGNWILTESKLGRSVGDMLYKRHVFHVHPKRTCNYQAYQHIKPYQHCKRYCCMPDQIRFLFTLMGED